jgi:hypothetical protein
MLSKGTLDTRPSIPTATTPNSTIATNRVSDRRALQATTPITTSNIKAAADECRAESADYNCPISQQTYGPIEDWDVSQVESMSRRPSPRAMRALVVTAHLIVAIAALTPCTCANACAVFDGAASLDIDFSAWDVSNCRDMAYSRCSLPLRMFDIVLYKTRHRAVATVSSSSSSRQEDDADAMDCAQCLTAAPASRASGWRTGIRCK